MADSLCFFFPAFFSPGLQCRSWPSLLNGPTTGSGYLVIYIHSLTVQHFLVPLGYHIFESLTHLSLKLNIYVFVSCLYSPCLSGDYVFAVSSDDNSDFWLSTDESPLNVRLLAWVGKVCTSVIFWSDRGTLCPLISNFHCFVVLSVLHVIDIFPEWHRVDSPRWIWEICQSDLQTSLVSWVQTTYYSKMTSQHQLFYEMIIECTTI